MAAIRKDDYATFGEILVMYPNNTFNLQEALLFASSIGHTGFVRELLGCGIDVNAVMDLRLDDGSFYENTTALMQAVSNGHREVVQDLVANGADVHVSAEGAESAFSKAQRSGDVYMLHALQEVADVSNTAFKGSLREWMASSAEDRDNTTEEVATEEQQSKKDRDWRVEYQTASPEIEVTPIGLMSVLPS